MERITRGVVGPFLLSAIFLGVLYFFSSDSGFFYGAFVGIIISLAQSFLSTGLMNWGRKKKRFLWIWGGGILLRLLVFGVMVYVIRYHTDLHFSATLITMIISTTVFLVVETLAFLN